jgi:putative addiction module component
MRTEELEVEALKLPPKDRARLAEKLLHSLETLSDEENARLWAEEAQRRDDAWERESFRQASRRRCVSRRPSTSEVNVSFNPLAERELNDAARYYEIEGEMDLDVPQAIRRQMARCHGHLEHRSSAVRVRTGSHHAGNDCTMTPKHKKGSPYA